MAALVFWLAPSTVSQPDGGIFHLSAKGRIVLSMMVLMALWWVLEVVPIYVTALLPLFILPITGIQSFGETSVSYGHKIIFLAFGGFVLAAALEKWDVHKHFARAVIAIFGQSPKRLIAGFMFASAILSMWISNTATAIIMLPIALSIIKSSDLEDSTSANFAPCLLLAICYACSMGGMTTLIGTTTNMFFAGYMESEIGREIGFLDWMLFSGPVAIIMLVIIWGLLTHVLLPIGKTGSTRLNIQMQTIPWTRDSIATLAVFIGTALAWVSLPLLQSLPGLQYLTMYTVAIFAVLVLFVVPAKMESERALLDWQYVRAKVPWGILILIGGGLALAKAFSQFGVSEYLALQVSGFLNFPLFFIFLIIVGLMVFLTEVTTNVASVTALTPVFAALAISLNVDPMIVLAAITLGASCAFMLPVATPPNAVIFGSERVSMAQMLRAGFVLNLVGIVVISFWVYFFGSRLLGA